MFFLFGIKIKIIKVILLETVANDRGFFICTIKCLDIFSKIKG